MLNNYSFGVGDRFGRQGKAQLSAFQKAQEAGITITPVWNKSFREHKTVGSKPDSVRKEADEAVSALNWQPGYLVDADHITMETVSDFVQSSDFFTIDVANQLGKSPSEEERQQFISNHQKWLGSLQIEGISEPFEVTEAHLEDMADNFLMAVKEAKKVYDFISDAKGKGNDFSVEVSMDEVPNPQTPLQLYLILSMLAEHKVPVNTIAPKFSGRFNKGVDYSGSTDDFAKEFEEDLLVLKHVKQELDLPSNLKLSVHTGSDKFSLYPIINKLIKKHDAGLHLKTAGTTWLEELIGLAESGGTGLQMAKDIYKEALTRYDELTGPYDMVLEIDKSKLPTGEEVDALSGEHFARMIKHDQQDPEFSPHVRQLLHTSYKIAHENNDRFMNELEKNKAVINKNVTYNIFQHHIKPLYLD